MIYFDNAATTRVIPEAVEAAIIAMRDTYSNPSSTHRFGGEAKAIIDGTRQTVADALGLPKDGVIFTSCATESLTTAITTAAYLKRRGTKKIVTTSIEHAAVLENMARLSQDGWSIVYVPPGKNGVVDAEKFISEVGNDTAFAVVGVINNEIGSMAPIAEIRRSMKKNCPDAIMILDAVQAFCKVPAAEYAPYADMLAISGHKIGAPKGIGVLYTASNIRLRPLLPGGGQEGGKRSGTENVPAIAALGAAVKNRMEKFEFNRAHMTELRELLADRLTVSFSDAVILGKGPTGHILSIAIPPDPGEVIMRRLQEYGIYVSTGSACKRGAASHVTAAMGIAPKLRASVLRISLCPENTSEEVDEFVETMKKIYL